MLSTLIISRIQFAFTISFHILFPAFSIGLATFLAIMEGFWLKTQKHKYYAICRFYSKIFALTFGMGIISGIVMEFQLGTNWAGYAKVVGPVLGSLFTYEVMTAFFIEAGFLGVMLFGWKKVSPKLHYISTLAVLFGVTLSAFWILAANSWMQTPAGAHMVNGSFVVDSWKAVIINHSTIYRFIHMMFAAYITTLLVVAGISAHYLIKSKHIQISRFCVYFALVGLSVLAPLQLLIGDQVGKEVHDNQPIKTAAIEGVWQTQRHAPFLIFAVPDQKAQKNYLAIGVPGMASFINTHDFNGKLQGLKSVSRENQPPVDIVFYSFRIMLGIGLALFLLIGMGWLLKFKNQLFESKLFLRCLILFAPLGFVAIETGWFVAETGRQPWIVYQLLKTSQSVSDVSLRNTLISFTLIVLVYGVIFGFFYFKYLIKTIRKGPENLESISDMPFAYMGQHQEDA